jgi:PGF-pre-PGF domain-containing protein
LKNLIATLAATILILAPNIVLAEILPVYKDGGETYTFNAERDVVYQLHPGTCEGIRNIKLTFNRAVTAKISLQPVDNEQSLALDKVSATCKVTVSGFSAVDIDSINLEVRVKKSWLTDKGLANSDVAFFDYDSKASQWQKLTVTQTDSKEVYVYYSVKPNNLESWALAGTVNDSFPFNLPQVNNVSWILIICPCLVLLAMLAEAIILRQLWKPQY